MKLKLFYLLSPICSSSKKEINIKKKNIYLYKIISILFIGLIITGFIFFILFKKKPEIETEIEDNNQLNSKEVFDFIENKIKAQQEITEQQDKKNFLNKIQKNFEDFKEKKEIENILISLIENFLEKEKNQPKQEDLFLKNREENILKNNIQIYYIDFNNFLQIVIYFFSENILSANTLLKLQDKFKKNKNISLKSEILTYKFLEKLYQNKDYYKNIYQHLIKN